MKKLNFNLTVLNLRFTIFSSITLILSATMVACTGQLPGSFRFLQALQTFQTTQQVNTKIDLLWIVDNSSSMDVHQKKLRDGFQNFMTKYLQPTWDIRVAVITTDTYLAHAAYSNYLSKVIPGSVGYVSSYLSGLSWLSLFRNPSWDTNLVNTSTGAFTGGLTYGDLNPLWGPQYALLKSGIHDGPITAFCMEAMPYFLKGVTQCQIRDNPLLYSGPNSCVSPNTQTGESSLSQCVNTIENDTVRSGQAIVTTIPPVGTPANAAWSAQVQKNFIINASVGSSGSGSERGLSSMLQLLADNETSTTAFFRPGSTRGFIFLSDEDDQSLQIPNPIPSDFSPEWGYLCDQASLKALNGNSSLVDGSGGLCCSDPTLGCRFGSRGTTCSSKTVDQFTYTLGVCVDPTLLIPVSAVKTQIDAFFRTLDGSSTSDPNYFVASIVPTSGTAVQAIQNSRQSIDSTVGTLNVVEADRSDRYLQLGQLVGGGSLALDISSSDYSPVLDAIGQAIVQKMSTFNLARSPTSKEEMIVSIIHQDSSASVVPNQLYIISGKTLTFSDQNFVLGLAANDRVSISYQPKTAY